ncbi:MAG TPA: phosphate-starvation-inducible protein PsiE [Alphaproteobacteria bacterium]|nr:phosphate-starvation-inducible protein PsiE [Alphaproteobacteria bacterium]
MESKNTHFLQPLINFIEIIASNLGALLVKSFHYLALFLIGAAIVWAAAVEFLSMMDKGSASIEDILLLFIYLELGAVVGIYFQTNHMPVRFLIYVAITALTRLLLELVFDWHNTAYINIIIVCGGILLLATSILVLRYASHHYPSK